MADPFARMLKDLQREHTRQLAELKGQITMLTEEIDQGKLEKQHAASSSLNSSPEKLGKLQLHTSSLDSLPEKIETRAAKSSSSSLDSLPGIVENRDAKPSSRSNRSKSTWGTKSLTIVSSADSLWRSMTRMKAPGASTTRGTMADAHKIFHQGHAMTGGAAPKAHPSAKRSRFSSLKGIVESPGFEGATASLIVACTLCNALEVQFDGMKRGYSLDVAGYGHRDDLWERGVANLNVVDTVFSIVFIAEFLCRALVLRCSIFYCYWSWLDLIVVLSSVLDLVMGGEYSSKTSKVIRMFRIIKVARILRALKAGGDFFNVLHVLMASIRSSFSTLCWTLIMIIPVQVVCALIMTRILDPFYDREDVSKSKKQAVFLYFGTFSRSLITFFEILLANYATSCRVLIDNVGEEFGAFIIAYRCICGFSVLCVVQAVFLQQSMKMVSQDSGVMVRERAQSEKKYIKNLEKLFHSLDLTGDGLLTKDEFAKTIRNDDVCECCHALGLDPGDLEDIYHMVDDGAGVTIAEFMRSARHIRKQARTIDMARVLANEQRIRKTLEQVPDLVVQRMASQSSSVGQNRVRATHDASTMTLVFTENL